MPARTQRLRSGLLAWQSPSRWLRFRCQPAIWRIGSAASTSSFGRRSLARLCRWPSLWFPGNTFPFPKSRRCVRAIAPWRQLPAIFERHHPMFHFDDASVPLIYLLLFIGASARTFSWAARSSFFPTLVPRDAFANAVTWNNSVFQIGSVVGPALSGFLVAYVGFPFVYLLDAVCCVRVFPSGLTRSAAARKKESRVTRARGRVSWPGCDLCLAET